MRERTFEYYQKKGIKKKKPGQSFLLTSALVARTEICLRPRPTAMPVARIVCVVTVID